MNSGNQFIWSFVKKSFTHRAFAENKLRIKKDTFSTSKKLTDRPV